MRYLLDVNALVAMGFFEHEFHRRVAAWVNDLALNSANEFLTCSITEIGFMRILSQTPQYNSTVSDARSLLIGLKASETAKFKLIADSQDISQLPLWVKSPKQITDGHLVRLAKAHGGVLTTLDSRIPGTFLIPLK